MRKEITMDKLDLDLLGRVEKVLNIKLKDWQKNYILGIPMVLDMRITGRATGKTLAYIIKLLFTDDKPIKVYNLDEIYNLSDWYSVFEKRPSDNYYTKWFRTYLLDTHHTLQLAGIDTRPVVFNSGEYERLLNNGQIYRVVCKIRAYDLIECGEDPEVFIKARLIEAEFDLEQPFERYEDFENNCIIFKQDRRGDCL
jgi:hypothetical protein